MSKQDATIFNSKITFPVVNRQSPKDYDRVALLQLMYLSREGDRREGILHRQSKGWFQVAGMGHEPLAVIAMQMEAGDYLFPYYRDRAMVLAKGVPNSDLASAYFAKAGSSSGGRQMPAHYSDRARNIWSVPTPTGSNCLPGCGVAWSMQLADRPNVVVATIGDAATRQGEFFEAVSFAVERKLPIIFVVEDNNYGISTNTDRFNPFKLGVFSDDLVAHIDARKPDDLGAAITPILDKARRGDGPTIVVAQLDRICSHTCSDDHRVYRTPEELVEMQSRDPIETYSQLLIDEEKLTLQQWQQMKTVIDHQVDQEYIDAEAEADPQPEALMDHLMAPAPVPKSPPIEGGQDLRMVDALNTVFRQRLKTDADTIFFGEDIESPKGGVFGMTANLSDEFPTRVFNSPLAEATIAGVGIGMATVGLNPVFEMQFVDFVGPAMNQISQNLGTLRWRSNGNWKCPLVLYAPYGAYLPGGSLWHSQANESMFAHLPGMRVVVPSTPEDAAALMWTAMHADDPTIFLIPKHLLRKKMPVAQLVAPVGFQSARIRRSGHDVTVVTWGNGVEIALAVADTIGDQVSVEVIDLRTVQPWDRQTVADSVEKTGRLVILQEDGQSCSVGQMIVSTMMNDSATFYHFVSPPQLVSKPDIHIGYNPIIEYAALPGSEELTAAISLTMEQ
jgi:2-oxoisovalerate dehydrogenase E1 component